ncbi:MAG TPA: TetR/AcrR family transcriptional regulator [Acidimicrobiales bacterium]|nr:TetR/AcrR family transcriptional regulator [Acidimicrobiales bacterium]
MAQAKTRVGEQRPGGRAERVRTSVLEAASDLLSEVGYDRLSVDEVAERAGVHKTTVYRRWPTKAELVAEAAQVHSDEHIPIPDTGSLLGDLQVLAAGVVAEVGSVAGARRSRSIVAAASSSGDLDVELHAFWAHRMAATAPVVERAIERGEVPAGSDPNLIIEALVGPIWLRLLLTGEPIDKAFAHRIAELVAAGATRPA